MSTIILSVLCLLLCVGISYSTPLAYYPFCLDTTDTVRGAAGKGVIVNDVPSSFGNGSYRLSGGNYINIPAVNVMSSVPFSIAIWAKVDNPSLPSTLFSDWSDPFVFRLWVEDNTVLVNIRSWNQQDVMYSQTAALINAGEWNHIVMSFDNTTATCTWYINGTYRQTNPTTQPSVFWALQQTDHTYWQVGLKQDSGSTMLGNIARLGVYTPLLTLSEIQAMAATSPVDLPPIDMVIVSFNVKSSEVYDVQNLKSQLANQYNIDVNLIQVVLRESKTRAVSGDDNGLTQRVEVRVPGEHAIYFSSSSLMEVLADINSVISKHVTSNNIQIEV